MSSISTSKTTADTLPNPRRWKALGLLSLAQFLVILDTSIIGVALPTIQQQFGFSQAVISVSENNVHVVWESGSQGQSQYVGSTNNGDNFSIKNIGVGFNPDIAAVGDNVYIVGQGQGENTQAVFFTASTGDGSNFGKVEYVTTMGESLPSVAAAS